MTRGDRTKGEDELERERAKRKEDGRMKGQLRELGGGKGEDSGVVEIPVRRT